MKCQQISSSINHACSAIDASSVATRMAGKHAVAVVFSSYPYDPRPRRAAEALIKEGVSVEVICLKEATDEATHETINGVAVTRIPLKRRRGGKISYLLQYGLFVLFAGAILAARSVRRRYQLVHIHNMPDFLVFSALVPKLMGARVILDLHDPMPELMMTIFGLQRNSFSVRFLALLEKWSIYFADAVLTVNQACKNIFAARSCSEAKVSVIMNAPDEDIFRYRARAVTTQSDAAKPFIMMYHGSLVERHGLDLAVAALKKIRSRIPHAVLRIYGLGTPFLEQVLETVRGSEIEAAVQFLGPKSLEEIVVAIGESNVGVIPNRRSIFTELNTPTRIFEYLSQGKPVIAPRAPGILDYFSPNELIFFELGDVDDLATKMEYVFSRPEEVADIVDRGQEIYREHMWMQERLRLVGIIADLLAPEVCHAAHRLPPAIVSGKNPR